MLTAQQKKDMGTHRVGRDGDCFLPVAAPPTPDGLAPAAGEFWNEVVRCAINAGTLAAVDGALLRLMADSWVHYLACEESLKTLGVVIKCQTRQGDIYKSNPASVMRGQLWKQIFDGLKQFGLSPRARRGMDTGGQAGETPESNRVASILGLQRSAN